MEISHSCSTSCWWWPRKQANCIFVDYIIFILFSHLLWECALHKYNLCLSTMNSFILNFIVLFPKHTFSTFQWTFSSIFTSFNHSASKSSLADRWGGVCPLLLLVLLYNHLGGELPNICIHPFWIIAREGSSPRRRRSRPKFDPHLKFIVLCHNNNNNNNANHLSPYTHNPPTIVFCCYLIFHTLDPSSTNGYSVLG